MWPPSLRCLSLSICRVDYSTSSPTQPIIATLLKSLAFRFPVLSVYLFTTHCMNGSFSHPLYFLSVDVFISQQLLFIFIYFTVFIALILYCVPPSVAWLTLFYFNRSGSSCFVINMLCDPMLVTGNKHRPILCALIYSLYSPSTILIASSMQLNMDPTLLRFYC